MNLQKKTGKNKENKQRDKERRWTSYVCTRIYHMVACVKKQNNKIKPHNNKIEHLCVFWFVYVRKNICLINVVTVIVASKLICCCLVFSEVL